MIDESNKNTSLQFLRGVAAVLVVLYHANLLINQHYPFKCLLNIFASGYLGVDLFFVLSGFIIFSSYNKKKISAKEFIIRRFIRIFPMYWAANIGCIFLIFIGQKYFHVTAESSATTRAFQQSGFFEILCTIFLIYIPIQYRILSVGWTLCLEMAFYLIFFTFFNRVKLCVLFMCLWVVVSYLLALFFDINFDQNLNVLVAYFNPIIAEFLFGCLIAIASLRHGGNSIIFAIAMYCGLFLLTVAMALDLSKLPMQILRSIIFGLPSGLLIYGLANLRINFPQTLIYLGDASYSIYLFHFPILSILIKFFGNYFYIDNTFSIFIIFILCISICCFIYNLIEQPLMTFCKNKLIGNGKQTTLAEQMVIISRPSLVKTYSPSLSSTSHKNNFNSD